jgi:hypothetical protein
VQAWNPHLQGDIDKIERIQRRASRIPTGCERIEYEDRLKRLSLTTLQDIKIKGDLIETYKVLSKGRVLTIWTGGQCAWKQ